MVRIITLFWYKVNNIIANFGQDRLVLPFSSYLFIFLSPSKGDEILHSQLLLCLNSVLLNVRVDSLVL